MANYKTELLKIHRILNAIGLSKEASLVSNILNKKASNEEKNLMQRLTDKQFLLPYQRLIKVLQCAKAAKKRSTAEGCQDETIRVFNENRSVNHDIFDDIVSNVALYIEGARVEPGVSKEQITNSLMAPLRDIIMNDGRFETESFMAKFNSKLGEARAIVNAERQNRTRDISMRPSGRRRGSPPISKTKHYGTKTERNQMKMGEALKGMTANRKSDGSNHEEIIFAKKMWAALNYNASGVQGAGMVPFDESVMAINPMSKYKDVVVDSDGNESEIEVPLTVMGVLLDETDYEGKDEIVSLAEVTASIMERKPFADQTYKMRQELMARGIGVTQNSMRRDIGFSRALYLEKIEELSSEIDKLSDDSIKRNTPKYFALKYRIMKKRIEVDQLFDLGDKGVSGSIRNLWKDQERRDEPKYGVREGEGGPVVSEDGRISTLRASSSGRRKSRSGGKKSFRSLKSDSTNELKAAINAINKKVRPSHVDNFTGKDNPLWVEFNNHYASVRSLKNSAVNHHRENYSDFVDSDSFNMSNIGSLSRGYEPEEIMGMISVPDSNVQAGSLKARYSDWGSRRYYTDGEWQTVPKKDLRGRPELDEDGMQIDTGERRWVDSGRRVAHLGENIRGWTYLNPETIESGAAALGVTLDMQKAAYIAALKVFAAYLNIAVSETGAVSGPGVVDSAKQLGAHFSGLTEEEYEQTEEFRGIVRDSDRQRKKEEERAGGNEAKPSSAVAPPISKRIFEDANKEPEEDQAVETSPISSRDTPGGSEPVSEVQIFPSFVYEDEDDEDEEI